MEQSPKQKQSPSPLIPSLPDDVTVDIVARVPRSRYPTLSLVSKTFRKLIASPKLYKRRSHLGITEHRVYALLYNRSTGDLRFHVLHRKVNCRNRLVVVGSLPPMSSIESFVPVGSKTYVFNNLESLSIDFASHTVQSIPGMPQRMINNVASAVDGKVYLIGDSYCSFSDEDGSSGEGWMKAVMVFDTETQTWEPVMVKHDLPYGDLWSDSAVMEGKLFFKSFRNQHAFAYEPREDKWELKEVLNAKEWKGACVVDDVLYYHDRSGKAGVLMAFDPTKQSPCWSVVNGLEEFFAVEETDRSRVVKCGEKMLALFFTKIHDAKKKVIFCAEIALGRRQGEIWGKVLSCDVVFEDGLFDMVKCVSVTV
ncbi:F-box/kelch-repeat protein [Raphanus sativus]|uniref:F-box/kelch-repeat protein At4g38940-like n=1 Tax=Raphanus sativus TaxID=3726 RepID=A0A9W3CJH2_RAPSA|nr:F-box/kelch-repeat protein At4g38940-like [Raphanus sativus]KAJ4874115.1 F-box/kelch-repeat protein [Raphanus sativus]